MAASGGKSIRNAWPALFLLGVVMLNRPFLTIFDQFTEIYSIPLLFHYLMWGWLAAIGVMAGFRLLLAGSRKSGRK